MEGFCRLLGLGNLGRAVCCSRRLGGAAFAVAAAGTAFRKLFRRQVERLLRVPLGAVALVLGGFVIAARIIMHGAVVVAIGGAIGAGQILPAIGEIGVGVAQALGVAAVAEGAGGRELDLHQPDAAAAPDQVGLVAALAQDHAMHQDFRHIVGR